MNIEMDARSGHTSEPNTTSHLCSFSSVKKVRIEWGFHLVKMTREKTILKMLEFFLHFWHSSSLMVMYCCTSSAYPKCLMRFCKGSFCSCIALILVVLMNDELTDVVLILWGKSQNPTMQWNSITFLKSPQLVYKAIWLSLLQNAANLTISKYSN